MRKLIAAVSLCCVFSLSFAQSNTAVNVGGTVINLPIPQGYVDGASMAPVMHKLLEQFTAESISLKASIYHLKDVERHLAKQDVRVQEPYYAFSVVKSAESKRASQQDFDAVKAFLKNQKNVLGLANATLDQVFQDANKRLNAEGGNTDIRPGQPIMLGAVDYNPQSIILFSLLPMEDRAKPGVSGITVTSLSYLLIKQKMVMLTRTKLYKSEEDLPDAEKDMKKTINAILAANK